MLAEQELDDIELYKDQAPSLLAQPPSAPSAQYPAVTRPANIPSVSPMYSGVRANASELEALGFAGATDEVRFFDYIIVHLKDQNFLESSPEKDKDWGRELYGYILGSTKQWQVQALSKKNKPGQPEAWDVLDPKTDLFFTLQSPELGAEGRTNTKGEVLSEWLGRMQAEGKSVFDPVGKEYLMITLFEETTGQEIIVQVAPSSAKYRWPPFTKRLQAAALRAHPNVANPAQVAEAMRSVRVLLKAGKKVENVDHPFYPLDFAVA